MSIFRYVTEWQMSNETETPKNLTERMRAKTREIHETADTLTNMKVALACTDRFSLLFDLIY